MVSFHLSWVFPFDLFWLVFSLCCFYFVCKHKMPEGAFQARGELARGPLVHSKQRGPAVLALGCHRGSCRMQPWSSSTSFSGEHGRGDAQPHGRGPLVRRKLCKDPNRTCDFFGSHITLTFLSAILGWMWTWRPLHKASALMPTHRLGLSTLMNTVGVPKCSEARFSIFSRGRCPSQLSWCGFPIFPSKSWEGGSFTRS